MENGLFQWVIGGIVTAITTALGWTLHLIVANREKIHDLDTASQEKVNKLSERVVTLETRPHIDAIEYTKAMTRLAEAITALTVRMSAADAERDRQHHEIMSEVVKVWKKLEELEDDILAVRSPG